MNIGEAVEAMKHGRCVRRAGWNGKGMHIYVEDMFTWGPSGPGSKNLERMKRTYLPHIILFNAQGQHQPGWNASTPDILATDWEEVPYEELNARPKEGG